MKDVYLDGAANTPIDKDVIKAMKPFLSTKFVGNSMAIHQFGINANIAISAAREQIATDLCVHTNEVYFTSGASEGNNWAIKSAAMEQILSKSGSKQIICSETEHDSVLKCCEQLKAFGFDICYIKPSNKKYIRYEDVADAITEETFLICTMAVNNEIGTENDIHRIAELAYQKHIKILVDCTQVVGLGGNYIALGSKYPTVNFLTFSAHKIYGPLGVGCLIARDTELLPLINGGAQENGLRGGTSNTAGIVGMAVAIHKMKLNNYRKLFNDLLMQLHMLLKTEIPGVHFNVWPTHSNIVSINCSDVINVDNLANTLSLYNIAVSSGSACDAVHNETTGDFNGSHVLQAIGLTEKDIRNTIRVSFTKYTKYKDIKKLVYTLKYLISLYNYK